MSSEVLTTENLTGKETDKSIKQGYQNILEKILQKISNAITTGSRSGSGKIILEHFDTLSEVYGGLPAVQSLNFDVDNRIVNSGGENSQYFQVESDQNTAINDKDKDVEAENVPELKSSRSVCDEQYERSEN